MKYYRFNQIAMAVLVAMLLFFGTRTLIDIAYEEHKPEKPGYEVSGGEEKPGEDGKPESAQLASLLAKGSAEKGAEIAPKCGICHSFEKGKPSPLGPPLHDVVGRKIASFEGFNYSPALKGKQGDWTYENLDAFITNPQGFAPGTAMAFPGLPDAQQRADVILFLRKETENPPPLPKAEEKPEGEAPEGGGKPGAEAEGSSEFMAALAKADPKKGEADAALCKVCHTFDKGGATLVGPNLYGVVGHKIASHEGVNYTPALKAKQGEWTFENLDHWLTNPQAFAPGTTMAFPGVPDVKKRANIIAYLNANSDKPLPLPEGVAKEEAAPEEKKTETPPAKEPEKPAEEKPAAPAEEQPPAEEKPAAPAEGQPPAEEKSAPSETAPPAAEPEKPTPPAAEEQAPPAETPPAEEKPAPSEAAPPAAEPEIPAPPAAEEQAPPAETRPAEEKPASSEAAPPAAEPEQPAPPAEEEAPSAETPPAEQPAPSTTEEPAAAPKVEQSPDAEPSKGEDPSTSQPQPVYPNGPDEPAAKEVMPPVDTDSPTPLETAPPPSEEQPEAGSSTGEGPSPSQPQPVYPDGPPPEGL